MIATRPDSVDEPADQPSRFRLRNSIGVLWLGRSIVVLIAERAHRDRDRPVRRVGKERHGVMDRLLALGLGHLAPLRTCHADTGAWSVRKRCARSTPPSRGDCP